MREVSQDLPELLDFRDFLDPKVLLVRLANPESRCEQRQDSTNCDQFDTFS